MKSWFQQQRLRKQHSETSLQVQRVWPLDHNETEFITRGIAAFANSSCSNTVSSSGLASRMSIERYLNAPLPDEPATTPNISAALRKLLSHERMGSAFALYQSQDTSADAHSEGRRTFFTSGSLPEIIDTQYTQESIFHSRMDIDRAFRHDTTSRLPSKPKESTSPVAQSTSGALLSVDMDYEWTARTESRLPGYSPNMSIDYRAKAKWELALIQSKAKELERIMHQYKACQDCQERTTPAMTNASAHTIVTKNPKVVRLLSRDMMNANDTNHVALPQPGVATVDEPTKNPSTAGKTCHSLEIKSRRRIFSNKTLHNEDHQTIASPRHDNTIKRRPGKRCRYYCTFCQKCFHNRLEWLRHECTIHMPEEMWVCCPRTGEFPKKCPFCEKRSPSPAHLVDHNYLSCQEKPLPERTFGRKDHFLQHISQVHKLSPRQKSARLTELGDAWRQLLPLASGHKALHCGFCGANFETYQERTIHVGRHFAEGINMMSWWDDRASHEMQLVKEGTTTRNLSLPHSCVYCKRTFQNLMEAQESHPNCTMWSCSFLPGVQYAIYPEEYHHERCVVCCYCNDTLSRGDEGKVNAAILKEHMLQHSFRACSQRLYFSGQRFHQHLQDSHKTLYDSTLFAGWTLLVKSCQKEKPSIFTQVAVKVSTRKVNMDPDRTKKKAKPDERMIQVVPTNFMDLELTAIPQAAEPNKLRRKASVRTLPAQATRMLHTPTCIVDRATTTNFAGTHSSRETPTRSLSRSKPKKPNSLPTIVTIYPAFYRRRLDASTRNRVYMRASDEPLSADSTQLFRR